MTARASESKKLRQAIEKQQSAAGDILRKIRAKQSPDFQEQRKIAEKFVKDFKKKNGGITYFPDQWEGTQVFEDAYRKGFDAGREASLEWHKTIVYEMAMDFYGNPNR